MKKISNIVLGVLIVVIGFTSCTKQKALKKAVTEDLTVEEAKALREAYPETFKYFGGAGALIRGAKKEAFAAGVTYADFIKIIDDCLLIRESGASYKNYSNCITKSDSVVNSWHEGLKKFNEYLNVKSDNMEFENEFLKAKVISVTQKQIWSNEYQSTVCLEITPKIELKANRGESLVFELYSKDYPKGFNIGSNFELKTLTKGEKRKLYLTNVVKSNSNIAKQLKELIKSGGQLIVNPDYDKCLHEGFNGFNFESFGTQMLRGNEYEPNGVPSAFYPTIFEKRGWQDKQLLYQNYLLELIDEVIIKYENDAELYKIGMGVINLQEIAQKIANNKDWKIDYEL